LTGLNGLNFFARQFLSGIYGYLGKKAMEIRNLKRFT